MILPWVLFGLLYGCHMRDFLNIVHDQSSSLTLYVDFYCLDYIHIWQIQVGKIPLLIKYSCVIPDTPQLVSTCIC